MMVNVNYNYNTTDKYLTDQLLNEFLNDFLCGITIIRDKIVPGSNIKNRPDYRIEELNLILEFNGFHHYTSPNIILNDIKKKCVYENMGYTVKHIPYWMQLRSDVIFHIFDGVVVLDLYKLNDFSSFPIGFHDQKCVLPASFCQMGLVRLMKEKQYWDNIIDKFYRYFDFSLITKILQYDSFLRVGNDIVMPYFVNQWVNRCISEFSIKYQDFPGIDNEIFNILGYKH